MLDRYGGGPCGESLPARRSDDTPIVFLPEVKRSTPSWHAGSDRVLCPGDGAEPTHEDSAESSLASPTQIHLGHVTVGGVDTLESRNRVRFSAREWFRRFRELYDASAASQLTELGLFYERHRKFVDHARRSDPTSPEYTDEEWDRVMEILLAELAGQHGLVQSPDRGDRPQLEWYLPGVTDQPTVVIRAASDATNSILTHDLVELSRLGSELTVFVMYPDYPCPKGTATVEAATRAWTARIERRLADLQPAQEMLAMMISAYSFDLPAPWRGFVWNRGSSSLDAAE